MAGKMKFLWLFNELSICYLATDCCLTLISIANQWGFQNKKSITMFFITKMGVAGHFADRKTAIQNETFLRGM